MEFALRKLFSLTGRQPSEQQKLQRILKSAVNQRTEINVVFGQRLARPVPLRGRFVRLDSDRILIMLDTSAVFDAWLHEPCSVYFSVSCDELSGSYAFSTQMLAHETRDQITRAFIALPQNYVNRQVRRFERLSPDMGMVHRMGVWNLKYERKVASPDDVPMHLLARFSAPHAAALAERQQRKSRLDEGPPLVSRLPVSLRDMGPADFLHIEHKKACEIINVSAGGARMRLLPKVAHVGHSGLSDAYEEGDYVLLLLALTRPKANPMLLTLAGVCCGASAGDEEQDVKMRFLYWNKSAETNALSWSPVTLRGVGPLFDWVAQGLGVVEGARGVESNVEAALDGAADDEGTQAVQAGTLPEG